MMRSLATVLLGLAATARAVFVDEAYVVDWARTQVGTINSGNAVTAGDGSLIGVYSDQQVLASLNSTDGSLIWRRDFREGSGGSLVTVTSGIIDPLYVVSRTLPASDSRGRAHISSWNPLTGAQDWEVILNGEANSLVNINKGKDLLVGLSDGQLVRIDGFTGLVTWSAAVPGDALAVFNLGSRRVGVVSQTGSALSFDVVEVDGTVSSTKSLASDGTLVFAQNNVLVWSESSKLSLATVSTDGKLSTESLALSTSGPVTVSVVGSNLAVLAQGSRCTETHVFTISDKVTKIPGSTGKCDSTGLVWSKAGGLSLSASARPSLPLLSVNGNLLVQHSDGDLELQDTWTRDEGLADAVAAVFFTVDRSDSSLSEEELLFEETADVLSAFKRRVNRHVEDFKYLPHYLQNKFNLSAVLTTDPSVNSDLFGFNKLLVVATSKGSVYALDSKNGGETVWAKHDLLNSQQVAGLVVSGPNVYLVGSKGSSVIIDGSSGNVLGGAELDLHQEEIIERILSTAEYHDEVLAVTSENRLINVVTESLGSKHVPFYSTKVSDDLQLLEGVYYPEEGVATHSWKYNAGEGYRIVATAKRAHDDLSGSIGKVLGDRSVLYKYLHRNAVAVASINEASKTLQVAIIDSVTGRLLHSKVHKDGVVASKGVNLVYGEHWLIYSFESQRPSEGQKLVVWDLYESAEPNERVSESNGTYSSFDGYRLPHVKAQAFHVPESILSLATSKTKFGVTSRDILATLSSGRVISIPKLALDARRPVGRKPTAEEAEEGLMPYDSVLPLPANSVVTHSRSIVGAEHIITEAANLESTCLVGVYGGGDIFFTRITPSKPFDILTESFDKGKLIFTVVTLLFITMVLRPIVQRKRLNILWGKR